MIYPCLSMYVYGYTIFIAVLTHGNEMTMNSFYCLMQVIQHIPNAFGAICLNNQGLEIFKEANPIDKFFSIFTSTEHLRALQDNDLASVLGPSIDELMRHHPSLKPSIMNSIQTMLHRILELGQADPSTI